MLDSGIDLDHPDLKQNIIPGYDFVNDNSDAWDDNGHGTAIAGVIGAIGNNSQGIAGVDWQSKLMPLKVVDGDGIGTYYDVAQGIIYAADHNARIINLSIGGYAYSYALKDAVDYALEKGCVLVAAVGNDGIDTPMYPAAYEGVIGIAATDSQDRIDRNSNYGDFVDLAAPGLSIYTTEPEGRYGYSSGSSLACSHTAGLVGLILSSNPSLSKDNIEGILYNSCDYIKEDKSYGHGRINAYRALLTAKGIENIDIAILHLEVIPESPFPGQETEISVTLQNQGNVKTPGSILRLYIDDVAVNNATIPSLAPNEVIIKKFNWLPESSRKETGN
jgi:subtilisin family serine protease